MSDSVQPHRWQPTRLPGPWDSPGKNTGVGCHFLLQCMKAKSENEVAQSCPTLSDPMECSPPGSSVHGIFQARVLEWGATAFSSPPPGVLPNSGIKFMSVYVSCIGRWVLDQLCHLGSLVSLGPCKHWDAGLHSGRVSRDSAPLSEPPFLHCSFHTIQLHSFQHLPTRSTPSGPGADTALIFSSTAQVSQNVMTCSGKVLGESQRHPVLHYLRPFNLCLWMETT